MDIVVFQQQGSGRAKLAGIRTFGRDIEIKEIFDLPGTLPEFIDDPETYFPGEFNADLVLSFLSHPDLLDHLARLCQEKGIPVIASGKKCDRAITPFTCCTLGRTEGLGSYGARFGLPEYRVTLDNGVISGVEVKRGASCGATWDVIPVLIGLTPAQARERIAREVQYLCAADPSNFDPVTGKSALHVAGKVHAQALDRALPGP